MLTPAKSNNDYRQCKPRKRAEANYGIAAALYNAPAESGVIIADMLCTIGLIDE
jgi:hypothetical protein